MAGNIRLITGIASQRAVVRNISDGGMMIEGLHGATQGQRLLVRLADDSGELLLRFLNFYPTQLKSYAAGRLLRVRIGPMSNLSEASRVQMQLLEANQGVALIVRG